MIIKTVACDKCGYVITDEQKCREVSIVFGKKRPGEISVSKEYQFCNQCLKELGWKENITPPEADVLSGKLLNCICEIVKQTLEGEKKVNE